MLSEKRTFTFRVSEELRRNLRKSPCGGVAKCARQVIREARDLPERKSIRPHPFEMKADLSREEIERLTELAQTYQITPREALRRLLEMRLSMPH